MVSDAAQLHSHRSTSLFPTTGRSGARRISRLSALAACRQPLFEAGCRLAPVPRAVIDAARRLRDAREITELIADPVQRGLCTVAHLGIELAECGRRGSATPRRHPPRGRCRHSLRRGGRRQAAVAAVGPTRAVVERARSRSVWPVPRNRGRLVRRGSSGLGDQLAGMAPQPDRLRARAGADGALRRRGRARAADTAGTDALRRPCGSRRAVRGIHPCRLSPQAPGTCDPSELIRDCSRVALLQSDCSKATLLQSPPHPARPHPARAAPSPPDRPPPSTRPPSTAPSVLRALLRPRPRSPAPSRRTARAPAGRP